MTTAKTLAFPVSTKAAPMTDGYLDRDQVAELRDLLQQIPGVVEDVVNVECKTSRTTRPTGGGRSKPGSKMPLHLGAVEVADLLHNTLVGWVRFTIETRGGEYPRNATISLAAWLDRHAESLSLCEGSEEAVDEIRYAIGECRRMVDIPPEDVVRVDSVMLSMSVDQPVTGPEAAKVAPELGDMAKGLTAKRVTYLRNRELLTGKQIGDEWVYRLGDILHAHQKAQVYKLKAG